MDTCSFEILHLDPLAQGVAKSENQIYFICKTLPGEQGKASIYRKSKGVNKAVLLSPNDLTVSSPNRLGANCPHYNECSACHFLHTDYESELLFKKNALEWILKKLSSPDKIQVHANSARSAYRNRIQLHYRKSQSKIGYISTFTDEILPVPHCQLPIPQVQEKMRELFQNNKWQKLLPSDAPDEGHLEIYQKGDKLLVSINAPYAATGFTQVNAPMNRKIQNLIADFGQGCTQVLDLFGGNGNLSTQLSAQQIQIVDQYHQTPAATGTINYFNLNLYGKNSFSTWKNKTFPQFSPDFLIIDPPRSGFKNAEEWIKAYPYKKIVYVSCNPHTLSRDLPQFLDHFKISQIHLADLFPGTHHFETIIFMERNEGN